MFVGRSAAGRGRGGFYTDIGDFADQSGGQNKRRRSRRRNKRRDEESLAVSEDLKNFAESLKVKNSQRGGSGGGNVVLAGHTADLLPGQQLGRFDEGEENIHGNFSIMNSALVAGSSEGFFPEASAFEDDDPTPL